MRSLVKKPCCHTLKKKCWGTELCLWGLSAWIPTESISMQSAPGICVKQEQQSEEDNKKIKI